MIFLATTTDTFEVVTDSAASVDFNASYVDANQSTLAPSGSGRVAGNIASATTTSLVAAPAGSTTRTLKHLTLKNKDAALSVNVTVRINLNGTSYEITPRYTLTPGDCLEYAEPIGWFLLTNVTTSVVDANANTSDLTLSSADTYLTGGSLNVTGLLQAGALFRWSLVFSKTGAGTATPIFNIRYGTAGTTGDAAICTFTLLAQTAATDTGSAWLEAIVRAVGASGQVQGVIEFQHNNTTTGLANAAQVQVQKVLSSTFDTTPSNSKIGLSVNPGSSGVWTVQSCTLSAHNLLKQR